MQSFTFSHSLLDFSLFQKTIPKLSMYSPIGFDLHYWHLFLPTSPHPVLTVGGVLQMLPSPWLLWFPFRWPYSYFALPSLFGSPLPSHKSALHITGKSVCQCGKARVLFCIPPSFPVHSKTHTDPAAAEALKYTFFRTHTHLGILSKLHTYSKIVILTLWPTCVDT